MSNEDHSSSTIRDDCATDGNRDSKRAMGKDVPAIPRVLSSIDISDAIDVVAKSRLYYALEGR